MTQKKTAGATRLLRFKPYPAYKHSDVEWLGEIPKHWDVKRLKRLFRVENGSTPRSEDPTSDGDIPWVTPDDLGRLSGTVLNETARCITRAGYESCGTRMVPAGSMILSTRAPIGHVAIAGVPLCTNQGCRALVFRNDDHSRFFYFKVLAATPILKSMGRGSTFKELAKDDLEGFALAGSGTPKAASSSLSNPCKPGPAAIRNVVVTIVFGIIPNCVVPELMGWRTGHYCAPSIATTALIFGAWFVKGRFDLPITKETVILAGILVTGLVVAVGLVGHFLGF